MRIVKGYDFDDVLIVPIPGGINSREEVDISYKTDTFSLALPVIASPMKGIVNPKFLVELDKLGSMGILHRFYSEDYKWYQDVKYLASNAKNWGVSIGLNKDWVDNARIAVKMGAKIVCVDVANGYTSAVNNFVLHLSSELADLNVKIMAGNVVTYIGAQNLANFGADYIRVGIGSGGLCTTRNITGVGFPQLSALEDTSRTLKAEIVSDGGIRNSGDIIKALVAGADLVMIGSLFATTYESANNGIIYGMASKSLQEEYYANTKSIEGIQKEVKQTKSLKELIDELSWGMKSACTYLNAKTLKELNGQTFVEVGRNTIKSLE